MRRLIFFDADYRSDGDQAVCQSVGGLFENVVELNVCKQNVSGLMFLDASYLFPGSFLTHAPG